MSGNGKVIKITSPLVKDLNDTLDMFELAEAGGLPLEHSIVKWWVGFIRQAAKDDAELSGRVELLVRRITKVDVK